MTQEEFDKAPLLDQILYDETGMLVENHLSIAKAMEKYHQAKLKLLAIPAVVGQSEQLVCNECGKDKPENLNYCKCYEGVTWIKKQTNTPDVSVTGHPLPRPMESWKNARNMELSDYIEWHLGQERSGNVSIRTFKVGDSVKWHGMDLIVVEVGIGQILIATSKNVDDVDYNDWWVNTAFII